jgi:hypothetical protein
MDDGADRRDGEDWPDLDGLEPDEALDRLGDWLATQDATHLREGALRPWLEAHPAADADACRAGWIAACDASAKFVHGYRRAPWASGAYAVPMRVSEWRALVGWYSTGRYEPDADAPAPLARALAAWLESHPAGDQEAFAAGWRAACRTLGERATDYTIIRGSTVIDIWLMWLQVYKTGRFARVTTGANWPERTSIPTRVLRGSLSYLAAGDEPAARRVFQRKAPLTVDLEAAG